MRLLDALPGPRAPFPRKSEFFHHGNSTILVAPLVPWLLVEASLVCSPLLWALVSGQDPATWSGEQGGSR